MLGIVPCIRLVKGAAELLKNLQEGGAQLIACQMSMDVMGIRHEELIDGVKIGGVAAFPRRSASVGGHPFHLSLFV